MGPAFVETPVCCLPRSFRTKTGVPVELHRLTAASGQRLIDMYLAFQPRNSFQGLPPIKDEVCRKWVRDMLATGVHITAWAGRPGTDGSCLPDEPEGAIGHAALFPINAEKCEMLVVVCPGFQNSGIGTELVRSSIDLAEELGFQRIWLPVDATNVRARHVYRKCGFEYVSGRQGHELDMACEVRLFCSSKPQAAVASAKARLAVAPLVAPSMANVQLPVFNV
jgi:RimJ/RimL family protein N-acetyltransferase